MNDAHKGKPIILQPATLTNPHNRIIQPVRISDHIAELLGIPNTKSSQIAKNPIKSNEIRSQPQHRLTSTMSNGSMNKANSFMPTINNKQSNSNIKTSPKSSAIPSLPLLSSSALSSPNARCHHTKCRLHHHMDTLKMSNNDHLATLAMIPKRLRPKLMVYPRPIHDHNNFPIFDFTTDTNSYIT